jgi:hypothetical protein
VWDLLYRCCWREYRNGLDRSARIMSSRVLILAAYSALPGGHPSQCLSVLPSVAETMEAATLRRIHRQESTSSRRDGLIVLIAPRVMATGGHTKGACCEALGIVQTLAIGLLINIPHPVLPSSCDVDQAEHS